MNKLARWNAKRARKAIRQGGLDNHPDIALAIGLAKHPECDPLAEPIKWSLWRDRRRNEEIRITICRFNDRPIVDVRIFFTTTTGHMQASKKGIAIAIAKLPELRKALEKAEAKALDLDLIEAAS